MGGIGGLERSPDTSLEQGKLPEWVGAFTTIIEVRERSIPSSVVFQRKNLLFGGPCKPIESPLSYPLPLRSKGRIYSPGHSHTLTCSKASPCHALPCLRQGMACQNMARNGANPATACHRLAGVGFEPTTSRL